jgi:tetratricopeptide (TPR) repeat protein
LQANLANLLVDRVRGEHADNIERALAAYEAALTVFKRDSSPTSPQTVEWARMHRSLGLALVSRVRGDRADNLERAIAQYRTALAVLTREFLPQWWAQISSDLAIVYLARVCGDRGDNLEKAIEAADGALSVFTKEARPRYQVQAARPLGEALTRSAIGNVPAAFTPVLATRS